MSWWTVSFIIKELIDVFSMETSCHGNCNQGRMCDCNGK